MNRILAYHNIEKSIISGLLAGAILISGCSLGNTADTSETTTASSETTTETTVATTETTEPPVVYDFKWEYAEYELFDLYLRNNLGCRIRTYVHLFGYTDELNDFLTEFVNLYFQKDYETVPFSEVGYFEEGLYSDSAYQWYKEHPDDFPKHYLSSKGTIGGIFINKVIFSYLVQNKLPFGIAVPEENLKALVGGKAYSFDIEGYVDKHFSKAKFDGSVKYNVDDLFTMLAIYSNSVYTMDSNNEYQEFVNGCLKEHYGDNAPQIGSIISKEQYIKMFDSEPIGLSYIPGAVADKANYYEKTFDIDSALIGKWSSTGTLSQTFKFNEDGTGVYSSSLKGQSYNVNTGKTSNATRKSENKFTYVILTKGIIRLTYDDGTVKTWSYEVEKKSLYIRDGDISIGRLKKS